MKNLVNSSHVIGVSPTGFPRNNLSYQVFSMSSNLYYSSSTTLLLEHYSTRSAMNVTSKKHRGSSELSELVNLVISTSETPITIPLYFQTYKSIQVPITIVVVVVVQNYADQPLLSIQSIDEALNDFLHKSKCLRSTTLMRWWRWSSISFKSRLSLNSQNNSVIPYCLITTPTLAPFVSSASSHTISCSSENYLFNKKYG